MKYKFVDIHSHIQFPEFDEGRAEMIGKMKEDGIAAIVVGVDAKTSEQAVRLAEKNENLFASVGLHPNDVFLEEFDEHFYRKLLSREKVVAVGECGLDYYRGFQSLRFKVQEHQATNNREPRTGNEEGSQSRSQSSTAVGSLTSAPTTGSLTSASAGTLEEIKQEQKEIFRKHIDLALEYDKPLMVHCRPSAGTMDAYEDAIEIFSEYKRSQSRSQSGSQSRSQSSTAVGSLTSAPTTGSLTSDPAGMTSGLRGNMHFFVGDFATAQKFFALGFSVSFTGVITFANSYDEIVVKSPEDKIMAETDCPFVAPVPHRGKRNEPAFVREVVKRIAELRGEDFEKMRETLSRNAEMFIGLL